MNKALQTRLEEHLAKLTAIGDADQLAVHFQAQGLKALCGNPSQCAIARSIVEALDLSPSQIWVSPARVTIHSIGGDAAWSQTSGTVVARSLFSEAIHQFIVEFDSQKYPELLWD